MQVSGGIRFLPLFGRSGSGKSSAARELATHLPQAKVVELSRAAIASEAALVEEIRGARGRRNQPALLVSVVDQYEERVAEHTALPSQFVERLSLLDRGTLRDEPVLFIWLTTSPEFRAELASATSRNERILVSSNFELLGPPRDEWAEIVEETFAFHNHEQPLADFEVLRSDIELLADGAPTIGRTIELVAGRLGDYTTHLQDLSKYQVMILWPVTDGLRITRVAGFTNARDGYKLDWNAFYRELNVEDRRSLPLSELNRARLYFDVRLVPIAAADLHPLCRDLEDEQAPLSRSYLDRLKNSHFVTLATEKWDPAAYAPLRERESERAQRAREWYQTVTDRPTEIGRRIARCLRELGLDAEHEQTITSPHSSIRADVLIRRPVSQQSELIVELKAYAPDGTMPSSIKDAIRTTLKRHAQFGGFLGRQ
jgi:adenylate kinase family enzyme